MLPDTLRMQVGGVPPVTHGGGLPRLLVRHLQAATSASPPSRSPTFAASSRAVGTCVGGGWGKGGRSCHCLCVSVWGLARAAGAAGAAGAPRDMKRQRAMSETHTASRHNNHTYLA